MESNVGLARKENLTIGNNDYFEETVVELGMLKLKKKKSDKIPKF